MTRSRRSARHSGERTGFLDWEFATLPEDISRESQLAAHRGMRELMAAVLRDAIEVWIRTRSGSRPGDLALRAEVEGWVNSGDRTSPFSFEMICEALGLDPSGVRHRLHHNPGEIALRARDREERRGADSGNTPAWASAPAMEES